MHYIEIGQDLIEAIKGGADYNGQSETEEIVGTINDFAKICKLIADYCKAFYDAIKNWLGK